MYIIKYFSSGVKFIYKIFLLTTPLKFTLTENKSIQDKKRVY